MGQGLRCRHAAALGILPSAAQAQAQAGWPSALAFVPDILFALAALVAVAAGVAIAWGAFKGDAPDGFGLRRQAGGFGGAGAGWRLSAPLARMVAGLALVALGGVLALARVPVRDKPDDEKAATAPAAEKAHGEASAGEKPAPSAAAAK